MEIPAASQNHHNRTHQLSTPMLISTATAAAIAVAASITLAVVLYRRVSRGRAAATVSSDLGLPPNPLRRFTFSQLRRATSLFSPSNKLGQGGFGPVYRGALPSGQHVAVKLMDSEFLQGEREFQNELALASKILTMGSSPDTGWVVVPFGYCNYEKGRGWWRRQQKIPDLEAVDDCGESSPCRRLLLVYELMHNGSLQDALLDRRCPELLDWRRRFSIVVDIAHGLHFLHMVCEPPVIHGDIKPSNILLDSRLSAKIADFGLARLKSLDPDGDQNLDEEKAHGGDVEQISPPKILAKEPSLVLEIGNKNNGGGGDDDASAMGETAESSTTTGLEERCQEEDDTFMARVSDAELISSPVEPLTVLEVASTSEIGGFDRETGDSIIDTGASTSTRGDRRKSSSTTGGGGGAKDWWWRQDGSGGGNPEAGSSVKDYVMEWIRSEIKKERPKSEWITSSASAISAEDCLPRINGRTNKKKQQRKLEWWASLDEERKRKKSRPAREWWREEFCEELTNKSKRKTIIKSKSNVELQWWQNERERRCPLGMSKRMKRKSFSRSSHTSNDQWLDGHIGEAKYTGRRRSLEGRGSDIPRSCTVSSTPSMRGTICYVAPEYGGGEPTSEKCDIYSFGVLLLVIVSGRRPLQVTASPMSEFERANLISWARQLARVGRLLDLVDPSLRAVDREQALLCITIGLICIQRSPSRRPSIKEIVEMLTGQSEPPLLPLEFSPSPPDAFPFKSKRKVAQ